MSDSTSDPTRAIQREAAEKAFIVGARHSPPIPLSDIYMFARQYANREYPDPPRYRVITDGCTASYRVVDGILEIQRGLLPWAPAKDVPVHLISILADLFSHPTKTTHE